MGVHECCRDLQCNLAGVVFLERRLESIDIIVRFGISVLAVVMHRPEDCCRSGWVNPKKLHAIFNQRRIGDLHRCCYCGWLTSWNELWRDCSWADFRCKHPMGAGKKKLTQAESLS